MMGIRGNADGDVSVFTVRYSSTVEKVTVGLERSIQGYEPAWRDLDVVLTHGDERHVVSDRGEPLEPVGVDARGRRVHRLVYRTGIH